jgi:hypothetical protein
LTEQPAREQLNRSCLQGCETAAALRGGESAAEQADENRDDGGTRHEGKK